MIMEKFLILPNLPVVLGTATAPEPLSDGTTDGTADGFLVDTAATFFTDGVVADDVVVNITSGGVTTVLTTPTVDNANLAITNTEEGFFASGDKYRIMLAADANKLVDTGTSFTSDVSVGDVVLNGNKQEATVVSVDSDTQLTLSAPIISTAPAAPDADSYYIYSEGDNDGDVLLPITGIADVEYIGVGVEIITYIDQTGAGALNSKTIAHTDDGSLYDFHNALTSAIVNAYERQWKDVSIPLVLPSGMRILAVV